MQGSRPASQQRSGETVEWGEDGSTARAILRGFVNASILADEDWESLPVEVREELFRSSSEEALFENLIRHGILTAYQAEHIKAGNACNLTLGNYRLLDRLGSGDTSVVFRAEHQHLRKPVALKVFLTPPGQDPHSLRHCFQEMRAVAQLQHPNIAAAIDAGDVAGTDPSSSKLHYVVMEYIPGQDLEEYVKEHGPLGAAEACGLAHQVAQALAEAHKHQLLHRDVKPSNVRVTPEGQAKLLDFGLAAPCDARPDTIDYMAPEQVRDARSADARADIYGLGGTLFWCLTGRVPFPSGGNRERDVARRLSQQPPAAREVRPEIPPELDAVVRRTMALDPGDRYPTAQALMQALVPFLEDRDRAGRQRVVVSSGAATPPGPASRQIHRVLVVDDEDVMRTFCLHILQADGLACDGAASGEMALEAARANRYDLILLDVNLPGKSGKEVCEELRSNPPTPHLKIILCSGNSADEMAQMLAAGADDFVTKPFSITLLLARVRAALRLKDAQDRTDLLNRDLLQFNQELERTLNVREGDLVHARNALALALARLVAYRDAETGTHLWRLQRYSRCLAEEAANSPAFADQIDANFIELLESCAPLHDIGKVGLPDYILLKPGKLDSDERVLMQTHTTIGAETLQEVARQHGFALAFLQMATDIARHHHECYDGHGYPDRLTADNIPLAARLVAVGDVYDALRSRRVYKPALSHAATLQVMSDSFGKQFDPALQPVFQRCALRFDQIFRECAN